MNELPKVLYVEDDVLSRMIVEIILTEKIGLRDIILFEDSYQFEERIDALPFVPDIILLDIHMKPITGFQMLDILRSHPVYRSLPIIALTASVMNEEVDQLRTAGFNSVLAKPLSEELFPEQLSRLLNGEQIWTI